MWFIDEIDEDGQVVVNEEPAVEMVENIDELHFPFDDEVVLTMRDRLNIMFNHQGLNLNEHQFAFWNSACIHPRNCDESLESMQEMVERFQKNPGNLSRKFRGHSPLSEALRAGHAKCVDFIIKNHIDRSKLLPLDEIFLYGVRAPEGKFRGILDVLIKNNVLDVSGVYDTEDVRDAVHTAFSIIATDERLDALQCMVDAGIPLDPPNLMECRTPLLEAIVHASPSTYKHLLLSGAKNRVTFFPDDDENNVNDRVRVEIPIPIALIMMTATFFVDKPERFIPMLKIFKEFGGNLWAKSQRVFESDPWNRADGIGVTSVCKVGQNALDFFKNNPEMLDKFPPGTIEEMQQIMRTPMSLVKLSRAQIRDTMGKDYLKNIPHLWIPRELKKFLEF